MKQKINNRYSKTILILLGLLIAAMTVVSTTQAAEDLSHITDAGGNVFFAWDGESQNYSADEGSGRFSHLGGAVSKPAGSGCSDTGQYHNTQLSSEQAAFGANSLKTPYSGSCNNESFSRDTTIINLAANEKEIYIRWYQKWTGNWMNGSVQQKFSKFTPLEHQGDDTYATGYFKFDGNSRNAFQGRINNVEGQFNDGITRASSVRIYASEGGAGSQYTGVNRYWDNYNNAVGSNQTDAELFFDTNKWYALEMHIKVNSSATVADAVAEMWVDGKKIISLHNFRFYGPGNPVISGVGAFELQHIYYTRATNDNQPTYMDNIVIADRYIGPTGNAPIVNNPAKVTGLRLVTTVP